MCYVKENYQLEKMYIKEAKENKNDEISKQIEHNNRTLKF